MDFSDCQRGMRMDILDSERRIRMVSLDRKSG